jgi:Coenzyme PQQ synthesis protein D (PqqD)
LTFAVVEAITFEGGLLLLDNARQRLFVYNESAAHFWFSWAAGRSTAEIAQTLVQSFGLRPEVAERDVTAILDHWRSEGLIPGLCSPSHPIGGAPDSIDWERQPEPRWSARWTCVIRDLVVSFAIEPTQWVPAVRTLFERLEVGNAATPHTRLEIRATRGHESALIQDGVEYMRASHSGAFKDSIHRAVLEKLHPGAEWFALIHGGAVARNGIGIGLPATTGSGKSTLIAYLIKNGFGYLSDDLLPVTAPEGLVLPWPLPFSVKSGSWDMLLPLYPELASAPIFSTKGIKRAC